MIRTKANFSESERGSLFHFVLYGAEGTEPATCGSKCTAQRNGAFASSTGVSHPLIFYDHCNPSLNRHRLPLGPFRLEPMSYGRL